MSAKQKILEELNSRIERLNKHYSDEKDTKGNPQAEMIAAESKLLNSALANELRSISEYVEANITD